ncbi:hypothetical protein OUHCRE15_30190 [Enterobacter hormaechei subsp. xiangfangensis]
MFAGWRCAYPAYKARRPVQAQRRRAKKTAQKVKYLTKTVK